VSIASPCFRPMQSHQVDKTNLIIMRLSCYPNGCVYPVGTKHNIE